MINIAVFGGTSRLAIEWMHWMVNTQEFRGYFHVKVRSESQKRSNIEWLLKQPYISVHMDDSMPTKFVYDLAISWADAIEPMFNTLPAKSRILMTSMVAFYETEKSEYANKKREQVKAATMANVIGFGFIIPDLKGPTDVLNDGMHSATWRNFMEGQDLTEKCYCVTPMSNLFRDIVSCRDNTIICSYSIFNRATDFEILLHTIYCPKWSTPMKMPNGVACHLIPYDIISKAFKTAEELFFGSNWIYCVNGITFFGNIDSALAYAKTHLPAITVDTFSLEPFVCDWLGENRNEYSNRRKLMHRIVTGTFEIADCTIRRYPCT